MKKLIALAVLSVVVQSQAVTAIFRLRFGPNTSNPSWVSGFMNMTPIYQNAGPVTFPNPGNTVLTLSIDSSACPNTMANPIGFEWEEYSVNGGATWVIMEETWLNIYMPDFCTTAAQIVTCQSPSFDQGPEMPQVMCPSGG